MGKRTTYLKVSQDESQTIAGAWAAHPLIKKEVAGHLLLGKEKSTAEPNSVAVARYDYKEDVLSELKATVPTDQDSPPRKIAVHPGGDGAVIAFETECRLFEWAELPGTGTKSMEGFDPKLQLSGRVLSALEDVGRQNCLLFSDDGSLLASGGEDGWIRVFRWPSMEIVLDLPKAYKSIKDLDISFDSGFLAATAENSPCHVWDLSNSTMVATLVPNAGENFNFCRFSRERVRAFLFITVTKEKKGLVGVWDLTNWTRIGAKKFHNEPFTSIAVTHHGRRMALGTLGGDILVLEIKKMEVQQIVKNAHLRAVNSLEFSLNDKAVFSLSSDYSSRVTALDLSKEWKEWQVYLLLIFMVFCSMFVFYALYTLGEGFWQTPAGRVRPASPSVQDDAISKISHLEL